MKNSKLINLKVSIYILVIIFSIFITKNINSIENKIIFKINGKAYTTLDYEMRVRYLDFVGSNQDIDKQTIIDDFISANIFYQYFINSKMNNNYNDKIDEIFNNIKQLNLQNNKKYKYKINKENILFNIKIDFIRKTILESIINSNINDLNISKKEIDLLYHFKIKYINFENTNARAIKNKINKLNKIDFNNVISLLKDNNINFFLKKQKSTILKKLVKSSGIIF